MLLIYLAWFAYSFLSSAIMFFIPYYTYNHISASDPYGKIEGMWGSGFAVIANLVLVHHGMICIATRNWRFDTIIWYTVSFALFFPLTVGMDALNPYSKLYKQYFGECFDQPLFWLSIIISTFALLLPYYFVKCFYFVILHPELYEGDEFWSFYQHSSSSLNPTELDELIPNKTKG